MKERVALSPRAFRRYMKTLLRSKLLWVLIVLVVALIVVRAMLPIWVRDYVNRKLSEIEGYRGRIAEVDIHLWRGAYSIRGVKIEKTTGNVPVPFFAAPTVDLSVEWKALFQGALVGEIHFEQPQVNLVNGASKATDQAALDEPWTESARHFSRCGSTASPCEAARCIIATSTRSRLSMWRSTRSRWWRRT